MLGLLLLPLLGAWPIGTAFLLSNNVIYLSYCELPENLAGDRLPA